MKTKYVKKILKTEIKNIAKNVSKYCCNPRNNFTRNRKLSAETMLKSIIEMESKSLTNELIDLFQASKNMPTSSAFIQQRAKLKPEAFKAVFDGFSSKIRRSFSDALPTFAVDGSDIQIAANPSDEDSHFPGRNEQKGYNMLHLNALYDLNHCVYADAVIQKKLNSNEHRALQEMVDRSDISKALVIADRGYESYNNMAHIQEKGWFFLIRVKDGAAGIKAGLDLPDLDEFDVPISLKLTRKKASELLKDRNHYKLLYPSSNFDYLPAKSQMDEAAKFYELNFRVVRFRITEDTYETVLTNLGSLNYPPDKLRQLYASRWGIETSFRDLKHTIGMLNFHSKKVMCIQQEIFAHLIIYNFAETITSCVVIKKKQRKYTYKANFSTAVHMCRVFLRGMTSSPDLEAIIANNLVPIRPGRHQPRNPSNKAFHGFLYRIA